MPKRLELLSDLVPQVRVIAPLVNPDNPAAQPTIGEVQAAARTKGAQIEISNGRTEAEIDNAFAVLAQHGAGALIVLPDAFFDRRRDQIVRLAARHAIPAIYQWREYVAAGGLISYGPDPTAAFRQAGAYVGRILSGAKPGDLPVQQPTTFELVINLKTAKALSLDVPATLLARTDEVIE